ASLAVVQTVTDLAGLCTALEKFRPRIILLDIDLPGIDPPEGISALLRLGTDIPIVLLGEADSDEAELELFHYGVRGCCPINSSDEHYQRVIVAVLNGEIWIRRSLTTQLLKQLRERLRAEAQSKEPEDRIFDNLTKREREIASLVAIGESNKSIARKLAITERTVKAHLTEVFRKLSVSDRLKLAVLLSSDVEAYS
ncbi:MAG: response regulator transcription factor, partial [Burkholderiales bacterium]